MVIRRIHRGQTTSKKQPIVDALILNVDLWKVLLKAFPHGKMVDTDFMATMDFLIAENPWIKTFGNYDTDLFTTWLTKRIHVQMSHIRECKQYPSRMRHRLSQYDKETMDKFKDLMTHITDDRTMMDSPSISSPLPKNEAKQKPVASTFPPGASASSQGASATRLHEPSASPQPLLRATPTSAIKGIPNMFLPGKPDDKNHATKSHAIVASPVGIPAMFVASRGSKRTADELLAEANATPPLPAGRGSIRKAARHNSPHGRLHLTCKSGRITIVKAQKGNIRTYLCVNKKIWCQITEKKHSSHEAIITKVAKMIAEKNLTRDDAKKACMKVLRSWPA